MKRLLFLVIAGMAGGLGWIGPASRATAQEGPEFTSIERLTNQEIRLRLTAPAGRKSRIEISTNLFAWHGWQTLASTGNNQTVDTGARLTPTRFYRAREVAGTNVITGDHLATTAGEVTLHPINHASLVLGWAGKMIYLDPVGGAARFQGLPRADLILITHDHSDHFHSATIDAVTNTGASLIVPQVVHARLSAAQKRLATVLTNGLTTNLLELSITAIPAYNKTAPNHPRGVGNGYVLTIGGRRIYVSGDTEDVPEMRALQEIDVAFVCMNQPYTMTVAQAVDAVRAFRPKVVYPYHYRNADNTFADLPGFKRLVENDTEVEVRLRTWY